MASESAQDIPLLEGDSDPFKGVIIKERHYGDISAEDFHKKLEASLKVWKAAGKRGVWLRIPIHQSELVPIAVKVCEERETGQRAVQ